MMNVVQLGEWGFAPILDKLESFVANALQYVVGGFINEIRIWEFLLLLHA